MHRRVYPRIIVFSAAFYLAAYSAILFAQTTMPHPITSLPKPPSSSPPSDPQPSSSTTAPASFPTSSPSAAPSPTTTITTPDLGPAPLRALVSDDIAIPSTPPRIHPFSAVGVQIKAGLAGIGIDLASPLAQHFNLRGNGSFAVYNAGYYIDGITLEGKVNLSSANVSLDWYPFHGGFRISPGVTVYNNTSLTGTLSVLGGQSFDLGDGTYTSSPSDPVHGTGSITFGRRTVPSFTVGWGNMIPRSGRRFSVPFEIGFQYIGPPKINLNLAGTACGGTGCTNIATDPTSQADLQQELTDIDNEIAPLRFYPIISIGFAWAFGLHATGTP